MIVAERDALVAAFDAAASCAGKGTANPIAAHALVDAEQLGTEIRITATDGQIAVNLGADAKVQDFRPFTVEAKRILDVLKRLPAGECKIALDRAGSWATLTAGRSKCKLPTLDPRGFPQIQAAAVIGATVPAGILRDALTIGASAADKSNDQPRYGGSMSLSVGGGKLSLVSTDGASMAIITRECQGDFKAAYLPRRAASEVAVALRHEEADSQCALGAAGNQSSVSFGRARYLLTHAALDSYPNYEGVLQPLCDTPVRVNRAAFTETLERVSVVSTDHWRRVCVRLVRDVVALSATSPSGTFADEVPCQYRGPEVVLYFATRRLIDAARAFPMCETLTLDIRGAQLPAVFRSDNDPGVIFITMGMKDDGPDEA